METYLVKEGCGTHIVFDQGELERHLKMGWSVRPDDWVEREQAAKRERRLAQIKTEQAMLEAEALEVQVKRGPGRPRKAA